MKYLRCDAVDTEEIVYREEAPYLRACTAKILYLEELVLQQGTI